MSQLGLFGGHEPQPAFNCEHCGAGCNSRTQAPGLTIQHRPPGVTKGGTIAYACEACAALPGAMIPRAANQVPCPTCGVWGGSRCQASAPPFAPAPTHQERIDAWKAIRAELVQPEPEATPEHGHRARVAQVEEQPTAPSLPTCETCEERPSDGEGMSLCTPCFRETIAALKASQTAEASTNGGDEDEPYCNFCFEDDPTHRTWDGVECCTECWEEERTQEQEEHYRRLAPTPEEHAWLLTLPPEVALDDLEERRAAVANPEPEEPRRKVRRKRTAGPDAAQLDAPDTAQLDAPEAAPEPKPLDVLDVPCRHCGAKEQEPCRTQGASPGRSTKPHKARRELHLLKLPPVKASPLTQRPELPADEAEKILAARERLGLTKPAPKPLPEPEPEPELPAGQVRWLRLIACGATKEATRQPAQHLYRGGLFSKRQVWASAAQAWRIVSAKHDLVHPDQELDPYDQRPSTRKADRKETAERIAREILRTFPKLQVVEIHAGAAYAEELQPALEHLGIPCHWISKGLQVGEQLQQLTRMTDEEIETAPELRDRVTGQTWRADEPPPFELEQLDAPEEEPIASLEPRQDTPAPEPEPEAEAEPEPKAAQLDPTEAPALHLAGAREHRATEHHTAEGLDLAVLPAEALAWHYAPQLTALITLAQAAIPYGRARVLTDCGACPEPHAGLACAPVQAEPEPEPEPPDRCLDCGQLTEALAMPERLCEPCWHRYDDRLAHPLDADSDWFDAA